MRPRLPRGLTALDQPATDRETRPGGALASDRGSGSVLVLVVVAVTVLLAGALGLLAGAQAARARAQTAADLGALAAAEHLLRGRPDPCAVARDVVGRNGAALAACVVAVGGVIEVRSTAAAPVGDATAEARAGPRAG